MTETAPDKAIVATADAPLATIQVHPLMATIDDAVKSGRSGADLKELLDLYERMEAKMEKRAYDEAFLAFQAACPPIPQSGRADEVTPNGTRVEFAFSTLADLDTALPHLRDHGFTRTFGKLRIEGDKLTMEATLTHTAGHSETIDGDMPTPSRFLKNPQNQVMGATSYLRRLLMGNMLGMPVNTLENKLPREPAEGIGEEQQQTVQNLIIQSSANRVAFLEYFEVKQLGEIPTTRFEEACRMLNDKITRSAKT